MTDYIITIPKSIKWDAYLREVATAYKTRQSLFFRVPRKVDVVYNETKCYLVHNGAVRGWMPALTCTENPIGFTCFETGKKWPPGIYIERSPRFRLVVPVPMLGFRGIRKYNHQEYTCATKAKL